MSDLPTTEVSIKPRSHDVTTGKHRAPARAMLRAIGMTDADAFDIGKEILHATVRSWKPRFPPI